MEIYAQNGVSVELFKLGPLRTNVGLISKNQQAMIVDAPPDSADFLTQYLQEKHLEPTALLITHHHWDHISDAYIWHNQNVSIYAQKHDATEIEHPDNRLLATYADVTVTPCPVDHVLQDGDTFLLLGLTIQMLWIPGHVQGGAAYFFKDLQLCFVGDTLFAHSVGRSDLPGGDKHVLFRSIREKLYTLPDETMVIPGHGHTTTIGYEKTTNPFVRPN
ncbi:MAG: MBL fold metallo-hydrolase [Verrucomicrobiota bacterium]|nr:MAG: MBL fold metallo-hydrolase [Verrucomicrobiota bacterium]